MPRDLTDLILLLYMLGSVAFFAGSALSYWLRHQ